MHLREIATRLAERGHAITILSSRWKGAPARVESDGVEIARVGTRYRFASAARRHYSNALASTRFDVVVDDLNKAPLWTPLWVRAPLVLLVHHLFGATAFSASNPAVAAMSWLLERPLPMIYSRVPVIAVSPSTAEDLVARGFDPEHITIVRNGVDTDFFTPTAAERSRSARFVYVGRLRQYKRVDLVIRAIAKLAHEGCPAELIVAGRGSSAARLKSLARSLGVDDRVRFPGAVSEEEKRSLFRSAWANVLTSSKEGWGLTVLEAAACGTPSIVSDSPGLRDAVMQSITGAIVPHGDVAALADAMRRFIFDQWAVAQLGAEARSLAESLSWDRAVREMEIALKAAAASRTTGGALGTFGALRSRARPPQSRVPLPRIAHRRAARCQCGGGDLPYGRQEYQVRLLTPSIEVIVDVVIGSSDAEGRLPMLVARGVPSALLRADQSVEADTLRWRLDGWPLDPERLAAQLLRQALRDSDEIRITMRR